MDRWSTWRRLHKQGRETRKARGIILAAYAAGIALAVVVMVAYAPWWGQCPTAAAAFTALIRAGRYGVTATQVIDRREQLAS